MSTLLTVQYRIAMAKRAAGSLRVRAGLNKEHLSTEQKRTLRRVLSSLDVAESQIKEAIKTSEMNLSGN